MNLWNKNLAHDVIKELIHFISFLLAFFWKRIAIESTAREQKHSFQRFVDKKIVKTPYDSRFRKWIVLKIRRIAKILNVKINRENEKSIFKKKYNFSQQKKVKKIGNLKRNKVILLKIRIDKKPVKSAIINIDNLVDTRPQNWSQFVKGSHKCIKF